MALTLSQKERMILEDQKKHEESCITKYTNYANQAKDPQLKQLFDTNGQVEKTHLDSINQLLSGTVPQTNGQQSQSSGQSTLSQSSSPAGNTTQSSGALSDADMCTDLLMTEKFVSGAYDTAIFEFKDTQVRDVLNHIQKEEQQHGEALFQYMESNGMYNVQ